MRGMKKWQPFKSLQGQYRVLEEHHRVKSLVEKPELSYDKIEEINSVLSALKPGDSVLVTYYQNGMIQTQNLLFQKCDLYVRQLYFREMKLSFSCLLDLKRP